MHKEKTMRVTIDLPEHLLNQAMKLTHTNTKASVIVLALEELIRKSKIADLKQDKGQIDLNIDLKTTRKSN